VKLRLTGQSGFDLRAHTGSGSIDSRLPITISGGQERHQLSGKVRGGGPQVEVRTGSGSVEIE